MISRRQAFLAALLGPMASQAARYSRDDDENVTRIVSALREIRSEIAETRRFSEVALVREAQKTFVRANGKFPDCIDVGIDVWCAVQDWHVRWQQKMFLGRDAFGRYTIVFNGTTLVLRTEVSPTWIGLPYDAR